MKFYIERRMRKKIVKNDWWKKCWILNKSRFWADWFMSNFFMSNNASNFNLFCKKTLFWAKIRRGYVFIFVFTLILSSSHVIRLAQNSLSTQKALELERKREPSGIRVNLRYSSLELKRHMVRLKNFYENPWIFNCVFFDVFRLR